MMHALLQKVYFLCRNAECAATFCGVTEITHRMAPGLIANPSVRLPYTDVAIRRMKDAGHAAHEKVLSSDFSEPLSAGEVSRKRSERIKLMLIAGYSMPRIQQDLLCSPAVISSVRDQMKKELEQGASSEQS